MKISQRNNLIGVVLIIGSLIWLKNWISSLTTYYEWKLNPDELFIVCFAYPVWVMYLNIIISIIALILGIYIVNTRKVGKLKWLIIILFLVAILTSYFF